ncbi:hypothetical protein LCGC14_2528150 [marine sediment metagenome]|uniref:Uncharacterized protein n=1 Tax=marine sediment metagenome TaxID=412755 RepID=A0A0F9DMQ3_9ZZZZ
MTDITLEAARIRRKMDKVRADITALTGLETDVLGDAWLSGIAARSKVVADTAAGTDEPLTLKEAKGLAQAVATSVCAEVLVWLAATQEKQIRDAFGKQIQAVMESRTGRFDITEDDDKGTVN